MRWKALTTGLLLSLGLGLGVAGVAGLVAEPSGALEPDEPVAEVASVATLPPPSEHWVWVPDRLLRHSLLYDGDTGEVLATIDSSPILTPKAPLVSRQRNEIYSVDLAYARGTRGERTDFITIYDAETLAVRGEIVVPTRVAESNTSQAYVALLDDQRFLAVFNQFPNTSVSIVDLETRRFVEEIIVTGCSGIYPVAPLRFATLCGDGTVIDVVLDAEGHKRSLTRSAAFFDVVKDPVSISGGRAGARWTFISFEGVVHTVDFAGDTPIPAAPWPLMSDSERGDWRSGGLQHVALHGPSGRLYLVMHQGGAGSHKDPGPEIWVYDLEKRERVARFETPNLMAAFLSPLMGVTPGSFGERLLHWVVPSVGVHTIAVTQDAKPLLFARNAETGAVAVLDAETGDSVRILTEAGLMGPTLRVH